MSNFPRPTSPANDLKPRGDRRLWWSLLKWTLFAVVLVFVARRGYAMWEKDRASLEATRIDWPWLIAAGVAYLAGWLPSVWFWRKLMHRLGGDLRFVDTARAYYCGHLGKYIPGKASVLVIRAALMKQRGYRPAPAALTVVYETLVMMGTGLAVAVALSPLLVTSEQTAAWPAWVRWIVERPLLPAVLVVAGCAAILPVLSQLFTKIAFRMTPRDMLVTQGPLRIESRTIAAGLLAFIVSWMLHGLSLGCTIRAVGDTPFTLADWPMWTGAVSVATVIGFLAIFAPGGIGVREGILIGLLAVQPGIGNAQAVKAAVVLRVLWFAAEITAASALYWMIRPHSPPEEKSLDPQMNTDEEGWPRKGTKDAKGKKNGCQSQCEPG